LAVYYFYEVSDPVPFSYLTPTVQVGPLPLPYESEMAPGDYLEFAIADLAEGTRRGSVNAFGNAKRALHLPIDGLLYQYGLLTHLRKASFPQKLMLVGDVGMIPTGVVRNLNVERNVVEHEYAVPSDRRAQEAVDVAKLLVLATERLLETTPHEAAVGWRKPAGHVLLRIEPQAGELRLYRVTAPGMHSRMHGVTCLVGIRMPLSGKLAGGVRVAETSWKTIQLDKGHMNEWLPVIRELVNLQRQGHSRGTTIDREQGTCGVYVTLPISLRDGISWHEMLESAFADRREDSGTPGGIVGAQDSG